MWLDTRQVDSLWFGEGFEYADGPDYWLVEVSGLPFGLAGDTMGAANPWRGMAFGMGGRPPAAAAAASLWRLWERFGIESARMVGWWEAGGADGAPASLSGCADVRLTSFVRPGHSALLALASWADEPRNCSLSLNATALGYAASVGQGEGLRVVAPPLPEHGQEGAAEEPRHAGPGPLRTLRGPLLVEPAGGWLLLVGGRDAQTEWTRWGAPEPAGAEGASAPWPDLAEAGERRARKRLEDEALREAEREAADAAALGGSGRSLHEALHRGWGLDHAAAAAGSL